MKTTTKRLLMSTAVGIKSELGDESTLLLTRELKPPPCPCIFHSHWRPHRVTYSHFTHSSFTVCRIYMAVKFIILFMHTAEMAKDDIKCGKNIVSSVAITTITFPCFLFLLSYSRRRLNAARKTNWITAGILLLLSSHTLPSPISSQGMLKIDKKKEAEKSQGE